MNTTSNIISTITKRINKIIRGEKLGFATSQHPLYPKAWEDYCPALNIMSEETFEKLQDENTFGTHGFIELFEIGTLDFWDEYVEFFGSFQHNHALYTKLTLDEMRAYGLPECFLDMVETFYHPEGFKWHHNSLSCGNCHTTTIVVLGKNETRLYEWC